jgi:hypothetical protein
MLHVQHRHVTTVRPAKCCGIMNFQQQPPSPTYQKKCHPGILSGNTTSTKNPKLDCVKQNFGIFVQI